jgi:hypothetical protein
MERLVDVLADLDIDALVLARARCAPTAAQSPATTSRCSPCPTPAAHTHQRYSRAGSLGSAPDNPAK